MEFLKILLIIIICFYAFKFGIRLLMPYMMRKLGERIMKNAQQQSQSSHGGGQFHYRYENFGGQQAQQQTQKDSKVKVDYIPPKEDGRKGTETAGEFIDFEEVK